MEASPLEDILPLSPMQEGMLFHSLLDPDGGVDFEQLLYRFDGPLDTAALERAWQSVVARHTALRARLRWQGVDRPLQLIERSVTVPVTVLGRVPSDGLEAWLAQDRREGISLAKAPLLRVTLFRETDREHLMVLSFHHVLLDGWSVRLVLRDLMTCYRAESEGRRVVLEPAPQYRSFLRWLGAQDTAAAERYWKGSWPTSPPRRRSPPTGRAPSPVSPWPSWNSTPRSPRGCGSSRGRSGSPSTRCCRARWRWCCPATPASATSSSAPP